MANMNRVFLIGNLTKDPEVRYTPGGRPVGDLRMAVNRKYRTQDGQEHDETCYVGIVVWGRQAETCGEYLRKGSPVLVEGRLQYEEWERDGQKNNRLRVVAERVQFLSGGRQGDGGGQGAPQKSRGASESSDGGPEESYTGPSGDDDDLPF
jgi:single-strand DNA-binding protein